MFRSLPRNHYSWFHFLVSLETKSKHIYGLVAQFQETCSSIFLVFHGKICKLSILFHHHYLMVVRHCSHGWRTASPKFNVDGCIYLANRIADTVSNLPENIDKLVRETKDATERNNSRSALHIATKELAYGRKFCEGRQRSSSTITSN